MRENTPGYHRIPPGYHPRIPQDTTWTGGLDTPLFSTHWGRKCARIPPDTTRRPPPDITGYHRSLTLKCACVICRPGKPWMAIDPCSSLLPRYPQRLEGQQVAAMGKNKWRSKKSPTDSVNARAPDTAKKQAGNDVLQVFWTPVLARGEGRDLRVRPGCGRRRVPGEVEQR